MTVEADCNGRFKVFNEEPLGLKGDTDQFGSAVAVARDNPETPLSTQYWLVRPRSQEGRKYYGARVVDTLIERQLQNQTHSD